MMDKDYESYIELHDADQFIPDIQITKNAYYQALSELYVDRDIPSVFTDKLKVFSNGNNSHEESSWWGYEFIENASIEIAIDAIIEQLNTDFNATRPLTYTGTRYKCYENDRIYVGVQKCTKAPGNMPKTNFYFVMSVLSHPGMLLIAISLIPVSCVLFANSAVISGTITAAVSVGIAACYIANRYGFFAENSGTQPTITIEPHSLDLGRSM